MQKYYDIVIFRRFLTPAEIKDIQRRYDIARQRVGSKPNGEVNKSWEGKILKKAIGAEHLNILDLKYQEEKSPTFHNLGVTSRDLLKPIPSYEARIDLSFWKIAAILGWSMAALVTIFSYTL